MTTDTTHTGRAEPDNQTYGLHVWLCARDGGALPGPTTRILDCVWEHIVPALE